MPHLHHAATGKLQSAPFIWQDAGAGVRNCERDRCAQGSRFEIGARRARGHACAVKGKADYTATAIHRRHSDPVRTRKGTRGPFLLHAAGEVHSFSLLEAIENAGAKVTGVGVTGCDVAATRPLGVSLFARAG